MLNFLNVHYVSEEVLNQLTIGATTFKRSKAAHDFDPYTVSQREHIVSVIKDLVEWLIQNGKKEEGQKIEQYLSS